MNLLVQLPQPREHCYLDDKGTRNQDTAFWLDVIDQAVDMQVLHLTLSGGEVEVPEDAPGRHGRADEGEDTAPAASAGADEDLQAEGPAEKGRPVEVA